MDVRGSDAVIPPAINVTGKPSKLNPAAPPFLPHKYSTRSPVHFAPQNPYYSNPGLAISCGSAVNNKAFTQSYRHQQTFQDFDHFVVIDFEATCDEKGKLFSHQQEIIEFPSVIVNGGSGKLEGCIQIYVRPTNNKILTDYCKDLTGIQQTQVDRGVSLSEALITHDKWLEKKGIKDGKFAVVTWGDWDCRTMLDSECRLKNITKPPYFNRWINLKVPYYEVFGGRTYLKEAVEKGGLAWEGRAHCGLDDSKNTARLLSLIMQKGVKLSITGQLQ